MKPILPIFCATLSLLPGISFAGQESPPALAKRPNVLMIVIDDLNDWVGYLGGHPQIKTPHMDALAAGGTGFTNAHVQAPLCNASRTSVFSGLRPSTTGIYGLAPGFRKSPALHDWVMMPQYFARHGYFTACYGKVYHDGSVPKADQAKEFEVYGPAPASTLPKEKFVKTPSDMRIVDWGVFPPDDHDTCDWKTADNGIAQLAAAPKDRPFFVSVGFRLPHVPIYASQKWFDLYPEESLIMPLAPEHDRADVPRFSWYLYWKLPEPRLVWLQKNHQWKPIVRSYLASTSFMDSQIGRLLDGLKASGRADNTIVVLWSDNGWHLGEKDITGKNTLWNHSTRVPLIFAGPGVIAQAPNRDPAELLDIYPTLIDLCRLPPREDLEGHSLLPQLRSANAPREAPAITTANADNTTIRTTDWRYIRYADKSEELYNERNDPDELSNLASNPKYKSVKADLAKALPTKYAAPAPGSSGRTLTYINGVPNWEGKDIPPNAQIPELDNNEPKQR